MKEDVHDIKMWLMQSMIDRTTTLHTDWEHVWVPYPMMVGSRPMLIGIAQYPRQFRYAVSMKSAIIENIVEMLVFDVLDPINTGYFAQEFTTNQS